MKIITFGLLSVLMVSSSFSRTCFSADVKPLVLKKRGVCSTGNLVVDLDKYIFLAENEVRQIGDKNGIYLKVDGENIYIVQKEKVEKSSIVFNADSVIDGDDGPRLDIDLSLVLNSDLSEVMVYWRETYKHRRFRQGLIRVAGMKAIPFCEGEGGVNSSD